MKTILKIYHNNKTDLIFQNSVLAFYNCPVSNKAGFSTRTVLSCFKLVMAKLKMRVYTVHA